MISVKAYHSFFLLFRILIAIVLVGKIANWFFEFTKGTNQVLNTAMFSLIGLAYLVMGSAMDNKRKKLLIAACGLFLIIMNFFRENAIVTIIGIACILTPMLITKFGGNKKEEVSAGEF